jgi:hypothetical protein
MTSATLTTPEQDHTAVPHILRAGLQLGVLQSAAVAVFSIGSRLLSGPMELVVLGLTLVAGVAATIALPGLWTRARNIEGIAGAAGIGLAAAGVFLVIDVALFQPFGIYGNRWLAIGGGSNWWYHPIWWMVGTYMPWMGAWGLANQAAKGGSPNPIALIVTTLVLAVIVMAIAAFTGFPGAAIGIGTFGVSVLPALALNVVITWLGSRRA